jgi:predicted Rossmann fold flavoprotein
MRVVVVGAGAAGTMAAIFAAGSGAETLLLERTRDGGRKILISGGGRCNILPSRLDESRFVTDSSAHTLRRIVRAWPLEDQVAFFERALGMPLVEEVESKKLFPASQRARDVRDRLLEAAALKGADIRMSTLVTAIAPATPGWRVDVAGSPPLDADAVIVATGGLSVPSTGSDGTGLRVAAALGHSMQPTYPALTPLTADPAPFGALAGISLPVTLTARADKLGASAAGGFLFTHRGYSGPAVLDVSHVAVQSVSAGNGPPARISVRWSVLGDEEWTRALTAPGGRTVLTIVSAELPARLAERLIGIAGIEPRLAAARLSRQDRIRLVETLVRGTLPWTGDEGYRKAEVTGGGVSLAAIDPRTMESRTHKGLFLCGEMLDAFGPIGGYNFLWAWATGRAAGLGAAGAAIIKGSVPRDGRSTRASGGSATPPKG